jgi:hypothetical protein
MSFRIDWLNETRLVLTVSYIMHCQHTITNANARVILTAITYSYLLTVYH